MIVGKMYPSGQTTDGTFSTGWAMSKKRKLLKAVSWETSSNLVCLGMAYAMFGDIGSCLVFTAICVAIKIVGYCLHESLWEGK